MVLRAWMLMAVCASAHAGSGVYTWVDAQGITHYDDSNLVAQRLTRESIAKHTISSDATATAPSDDVHAAARRCHDLSERDAAYQKARTLYGQDPAGNQYPLSEAQAKLTRAEHARETVRYCRPGAAEKLLAEARRASLKKSPR